MGVTDRSAAGRFMRTKQRDMKIKHTRDTSHGTILLAAILSTGAVTAATTSSKESLDSSTTIQTDRNYDGEGLPMLATGVQELSLGGRLNWEDSTAYNFDISYGRFITSSWLVGVEAGITGINSDKDYRLGVFGEYNFLTGTKWVPFVRGGVGYTRPDQGDDSATLGLDAGIKYFMRSNLAIFASVGGDWVISGDDSNDGFAKQIDLGLKFYF
jgi:hypothetical protein